MVQYEKTREVLNKRLIIKASLFFHLQLIVLLLKIANRKKNRIIFKY